MDNFVKNLIEEVKSQGVFDEFRFNCCLADVDTKPAYQNVRNRVETAVNDFLAKQHWTPDTNKVQLRERLRKHLLDSDVLDKGVDHIVDQVVNPKVATIFEPKIESIAYKFLGITPPPPPANPPPRPPLLPAPPLPPFAGHALGHINGGSLLKVETTASLLPTDLEQISPDSDRATIKSDVREDSKDEELPPPGVDDDDIIDDDETSSRLFEPRANIKEDINNVFLNTSDSLKDVKELANDSRDAGASQTSQLSQVSSDSRLTIASTDVPQTTSANNSVELTSNIAANISEEAQMPKFNENSSEPIDNGGQHLHFDIKKDVITFEGTERRNSLSDSTPALSIEDAIMSELKANINDVNNVTVEQSPETPLVPQQSEQLAKSNFSLFAHSPSKSQYSKDSMSATPQPQVPSVSGLLAVPEISAVNTEEIKSIVAQETEAISTSDILPAASELKDETIKSVELATSPASASSSSQAKKHSHSNSKDNDKDRRHHSHSEDKQRRKSRDRERERERDRDKSRSKPSSSSKHSSRHTSHSSSSKHRSSSSKNDKSSASTLSKGSNHESSASKRSSSHHESSSSTHKKHKSSSSSSRSERDKARGGESKESHSHSHNHSHHSRSQNGSGSTSSTSKRNDRDRDRVRERSKLGSNSTSNSASNTISGTAPTVVQDDHNEEKTKLQKRQSHDSNDEGKPPGSSSKVNSETADTQTKDTSTQNNKASEGNGTNDTNGTNGTNDANTQIGSDSNVSANAVATSNVIIVSDMLQQSSANFIELSSGFTVKKPLAEESIQKVEEQSSEKSCIMSSEPVHPALQTETENKPTKSPEETTETRKSLGDNHVSSAQCSSETAETLDTSADVASSDCALNVVPPADDSALIHDAIDATLDNNLGDVVSGLAVLGNTALTSPNVASADTAALIGDAAKTVSAPPAAASAVTAALNVDACNTILEDANQSNVGLSDTARSDTGPADVVLTDAAPVDAVRTATTLTDGDSTDIVNLDLAPESPAKCLEESKIELKESNVESGETFTHFEEDAEQFKARLQLIEQHIKDRRTLINDFSETQETGPLPRSISKRRLSSEASTSNHYRSLSGSSSSGSPDTKAKKARRDNAKTSPTPSELSVNSKENEELEKGDLSTRRLGQKLCQQQRYTNDDLYKPRPLLSQRSRRRGLDSIL